MTKKSLEQLIPDVRKALSKGMEKAADEVVVGLQDVGPHWTGQFAASWGIAVGQTTIPGVTPLQDTWLMKPRGKNQYQPIFRRTATGLEGYTIGNLTDYKLYAMDILPTSGVKRGDKPGRTADKDWFRKFTVRNKSSRMTKIIDEALTHEFNKYRT